jgi:cell division septal protein FtsQ
MSAGTIRSPLAGAPTGAGGAGRVLDFRRKGAPPRRKRRSLWAALARPLASAALMTVLPFALAAWVTTARCFGLSEIAVTPERSGRVDAAWVRQAVAPLLGRNLVLLPLAEAESRIRVNPWVAAVQLRKELPDRLHVAVAERRPVALLTSERAADADDVDIALAYADQEGHPIAPIASAAERDAARRAGLLVVRFVHGPHGSQAGGIEGALAVAGDFGRVEPDWAAKLELIEVLGEEDYRLYTGALPFPVLVASGQVQDKGRRLKELLPQLLARYPNIAAVDLRFSRRIVVEPTL